ncbi:hypothetical protein HAX54_027395, partial [Datura stramonium]|nr:hypothetical protein [Datura stramonium]
GFSSKMKYSKVYDGVSKKALNLLAMNRTTYPLIYLGSLRMRYPNLRRTPHQCEVSPLHLIKDVEQTPNSRILSRMDGNSSFKQPHLSNFQVHTWLVFALTK